MDSAASGKSAAQGTTALGSSRVRRGYPHEARLLKTSDYRRVYDHGSRRQFGWTAVFMLSTGDPNSRVGITVPRHFGKAVDRNRIKRRLRSAIAECKAEMPAGWDIVLHPRQAGLKLEYGEVIATLKKIFAYCTKQSSK